MATPADVLAFRQAIPEFADTTEHTDVALSAALDEADMWLDASQWSTNDFPWARWFLVAHHIKLNQIYGAIPGGGGELTGGVIGFYSKSISFGERRVQFGERKSSTDSKTTGITGAGQDLYEDTIYGQKFLRLRMRNIMPIMTI